ncbi:LysR family transcriptional regulator [Arthrobacter sp. H14]|uniref:LysR family transcriptional regulator n=1 Tax=Arthrobacter sp. H14 TaxID=1312959 RepID=UPI00047B99E7|nr:LysR family transcriptional regulator [Arthrobacter sp. H14]
MNYRRIMYFLAVVDAGTVTAAAEILHIAQPALSRQLKTLEAELKIELFESRRHRLVLTQAGRAFVPVARRLMVETRSTTDAVAALRSGRVATLVVAATAASTRGFIAPFLAGTTRQDPLILTRETSHFEIYESLLHGADFVISPAPPESDLESLPLGSVPLKVFTSSDHEWAAAGRSEVSLEELCRCHVILPSHHSVSRHILDNALNQAGLSLSQTSECDDGQTILALSAAGHGVGVATDQSSFGAYAVLIKQPTDTGAASVLELPLHAAWMPGHFAADTIRSLAERLRTFIGEQGVTSLT